MTQIRLLKCVLQIRNICLYATFLQSMHSLIQVVFIILGMMLPWSLYGCKPMNSWTSVSESSCFFFFFSFLKKVCCCAVCSRNHALMLQVLPVCPLHIWLGYMVPFRVCTFPILSGRTVKPLCKAWLCLAVGLLQERGGKHVTVSTFATCLTSPWLLAPSAGKERQGDRQAENFYELWREKSEKVSV